MESENVKLARLGYDAWNRGDLTSALEFLARDVVAYDPPELPTATVHYGRPAVLRDWQSTLDAFEWYEVEPQEFVEAGDRLLVRVHARGSGKSSGVVAELDMVDVWTIRDGLAVELRQFFDDGAALEALHAAGAEE
jgi:ketosteroid isomerase-like protein